MTRRGHVFAVTVVSVALMQEPPAIADTGDDPGSVWQSELNRSDGTARVGAQQAIVDERRPQSSKPRARPAVVSRTEYVPVCGTPADPILAAELSGRSIACEGVPCTAADGRAGEKRFSVTKLVVVATGRMLGAAELGPIRCVALPRVQVSLEELVRRQFRQVRLPGSSVRTDPAAWTLVNYPTSFLAEQEWTVRDIGNVLGRRVRVAITPVSFRWSFGDGPGERPGSRTAKHTYAGPGTMHVSVRTTYRASYRVAADRARPIPGTVTVPGPVTSLDVLEARSELVIGRRG